MADNKNDGFSDILKSLKEANEKNIIKFELPVSKLEVKLKPLQAKHISKINSSLIAGGSDGSYAVRFTSMLKNILDDVLILPEGETYASFNIIDKHYIIFKIRETINPILTIHTEDGEVEVDIKSAQESLVKNNYKTEKTIGKKSCKITLKVPTFERHVRYNQIVESIHRKMASEEKPDIEQFTSDIFGFTLIEFLYKISVQVGNESRDFIFHEQTPSNQLEILNNIPKEEYRQIFDVIGDLTKVITDSLKTDVVGVNIPVDHTIFID